MQDSGITLCDNAAESCPWTPPEIKRLHWSIKDPAKAVGTEEDVMNEFRRVRDEIKRKFVNFIEDIADSAWLKSQKSHSGLSYYNQSKRHRNMNSEK